MFPMKIQIEIMQSCLFFPSFKKKNLIVEPSASCQDRLPPALTS